MSQYTIGIEDHYAWANVVSVNTSGARDALLDRRRIELLDANLPVSPYHHDALHTPLAQAEGLVREVQASADALAFAGLSSVIDALAPSRCVSVAIRVPPLSDWPATVSEALANTWLRNRADGMIYHHALTQAAARLNLPVFCFQKDNVFERVAQARGTSARDVERELKALGTALGPPWRAGQVTACAGAVLAHLSAPAAPRRVTRA